jgi:hypothetical protein
MTLMIQIKYLKMKSNKMYLLLFLLIALSIPLPMLAQQDLQISKVFDQYGKKKGVVMVELSGEVLKQYDFSLFKSIVIKNDPSAAVFIRQCLAKDQEGAKKIKQVVASGVLTSEYLELPRKGSENRMILYNESSSSGGQITLIYLESKDDSGEILNLLLKKK